MVEECQSCKRLEQELRVLKIVAFDGPRTFEKEVERLRKLLRESSDKPVDSGYI